MTNEDMIGGYRLIEKLGRGAAGQVYLATPIKDKPFASRGDLVAAEGLYGLGARVKGPDRSNEGESSKSVFGPKGIPISFTSMKLNLDDPAHPFLVMEYVDGMSLNELISMFHPISEHMLISILEGIVAGLSSLHASDVIHRDIKPENIMVTTDFRPRIMDFGVVKKRYEDGGTPSESFLGTIRNSAPEMGASRGRPRRSESRSLLLGHGHLRIASRTSGIP